MENWKNLPANIPPDITIVWVRINFWYGTPFLALWSLADQTFTATVSGIIYPAWSVGRWKYQTA